jgi:chemotaxis protein MotB
VWPGYVDALSALLMVVIFVLLIFAMTHFLFSEILSGQESELAALHRRLNELTESLGLERQRSLQLSNEVAELAAVIENLTDEKTALAQRIDEMTLLAAQDRSQIEKQLLLVASLQEDIVALRKLRDDLEARIRGMTAALEKKTGQIGMLRDRSKALRAELAAEQERTLLAQQTLAEQNIRIQALAALVGEQRQALASERRLSAEAQAEVALLNRQIDDLKQQLNEISRALAAAEKQTAEQAAEIEDLGRRLNIALARKVNTLERYRSEFFGRMREVLGENPLVRIQGDRFVFQSELLFDSGSADLGAAGQTHLAELAGALAQLSKQIPADIDWILRIDGHTDRVPIRNQRFSSNWELSTARAVSVLNFLAAKGMAQRRMAVAGFGEYHPLDPALTPEAYRRNRRIEIKLTSP